MFYKKYVKLFSLLLILALGLTIALIVAVDPLDIWAVPSVAGFNNYKSEQGNHLDVSKPYQYLRARPEAVFLGSSRVYVGFGPDSVAGKRVYNMGFSSLSIRDAETYFRFMCRSAGPETVYMGLDYFQFDRKQHRAARPGFSAERLERLAGDNPLEAGLFRLSDTLAQRNLIVKTVSQSRRNPDGGPLFVAGWDVKRGGAAAVNTAEYAETIDSFFRIYRNFEFDDDTLRTLSRMVEEAKAQNVRLVLFFNPVTPDHLLALYTMGQLEDFYRVKKGVAQVAPVWDFSYINKRTLARSSFYEASHFRRDMGRAVAAVLSGAGPDGFGVLLTAANADGELARMDGAFRAWLKDNDGYRRMLAEHYRQGVPLTQQDLIQAGATF